MKKFKKRINDIIRHKLIEVEQSSLDIDKWFDRAINLNRN